MADELGLTPAAGFVEPALRAEFPALRLDWLTVEARVRTSPPQLTRRLAELSNRYRGANVVAMRTHPVPHAYRAFFRQIGVDPDVTRTPSEQAAVDRLLHGGFRSRDLVADALLVALVETGVPVWALDADLVDAGGLGIRTSLAGDWLGPTPQASHLSPGQLVVADACRVHALLFADVAAETGVSARTSRITLFSVAVQGVPAIHVEEALYACAETVGTG